MIDLPTYKACLTARSIPAAVIATRPSSPFGKRPTSGWSRGEKRSLLHNCWLIATADPLKKRKEVEHLVSFDTAVNAPRVHLSHPSLNGDRLTKKILTLTSLSIGPRGNGGLDATFVAQMGRRFDWVLRYRLAEGCGSFSDIAEDFASDLSKRLTLGGTLALVPIEERLDAMLKARTDAGPIKIDYSFASELGVTAAALSRSPSFRAALIDADPSLSFNANTFKDEDEDDDNDSAGGDGESWTWDDDDTKKRIISDKNGRRNLHAYLEILEFLYRLSERDLDHDRMKRNPFEEMSMEAILDRDRKMGGRTDTIFPEDMMRIMSAAADFLSNYGGYVLATLKDARPRDSIGTRAIEMPRTRKLMPKGGFRILPVWNTGGGGRELLPPRAILLDEAIRHLFASCAILLGGFVARRDIGVRSAHFGCLTEDEHGLLKMNIYIGKTDKDRVDIPVPSIIKTVVETLEGLSADTREATGKAWLFEVAIDPMKPDRMVSSRFHQIMDQFLEFYRVEPPEGLDRWNIGIHMLRRGYGIWYYYGLIGGSPDALSLMFRHNDPNMTRIYFTMILPGEINRLKTELEVRLQSSVANRTQEDKSWIDSVYRRLSYLKDHQKAFDEPRCEMFVHKMLGLWQGTESVIGAGGKALFNDVKAIAERAMGSVRIGSRANDPSAVEAPLLERFIAYAKSHFLEPVIGTNMWCAADPNNEDHRADAECLTLKAKGKAPWKKDGLPETLIPDYDFACNRICVGCRFGAAFQDGQLALVHEVKQRRQAVPNAATTALRNDGSDLLAELEAEIAAAGPAQTGGAL